jgi:thiol:disulfide interchange protein
MRATYADPTVKQALNTAGVGLIYYLDVLGPEANVARQFGVQGVPAYFIVDAQGKAINSGVGYLAPEGFIGWLNQGSHILR